MSRLVPALRIVLAALALVVLVGVASPQSASALAGKVEDTFKCRAAPPFSTPNDGPAAFLDPGPETVPEAADPFAAAPKPGEVGPFPAPETSIYQQYGYGGLGWLDYDPGCVAEAVPIPSTTGVLADLVMEYITLCVASTVTLTRIAFSPGSFDVLNPLLTAGSDAIGKSFYYPLIGVVLSLVAIFVLTVYVLRGRLAASINATLWVIALLAAAGAAIAYPLTLAPTVDRFVTTTVSQGFTAVAGPQYGPEISVGDAVGASLVQSVLYEPWCAGEVGRSSPEVAREFCPELLKTSTASRAEMAEIEASGDPDALAKLATTRAGEFRNVADRLEKEHETSYRHLGGKENLDRLGYSGFAGLAWASSGGFVWLSNLYMAYSLLVFRGGLLLLPLVALAGSLPPLRFLVLKLVTYVGAAIGASVLLGLFSALLVRASGVLISPTGSIPWPLAVTFLLLMSIGMLVASLAVVRVGKLSKAVRKGLHKMSTNKDGSDSALGVTAPGAEEESGNDGSSRVGKVAKVALRTVVASAAGGAAGGAAATVINNQNSDDAPAPTGPTASSSGPSAPALASSSASLPAIGAAPEPAPYTPPKPQEGRRMDGQAPLREPDTLVYSEGADGVWEATEAEVRGPRTGADAS